MRAVTAVIIALLAFGAPATAAAPTKQGGQRAQAGRVCLRREHPALDQRLSRASRQPDKVPAAVQAMSELGLFRDLETAGVYVGFMAGVLQTNPKKAEELVAKMFPMPPEDQVVHRPRHRLFRSAGMEGA